MALGGNEISPFGWMISFPVFVMYICSVKMSAVQAVTVSCGRAYLRLGVVYSDVL